MKIRSHRFVVAILMIHGLMVLAGCENENTMGPVASPSAPSENWGESKDPGLLRTIMVQLGEDMNAVSRGLWLEELSAVAIAATAIAEHPHVSTAERTRIQNVLGTRFGNFVASDKRVHSAAVRLSIAATANDLSATLDELTRLQAACVTCHSDHREALR